MSKQPTCVISPCYDSSTNPVTWLYKADQFFYAHCALDEKCVWFASFYMEGEAQDWFYRLE